MLLVSTTQLKVKHNIKIKPEGGKLVMETVLCINCIYKMDNCKNGVETCNALGPQVSVPVLKRTSSNSGL